MRNFSNGLMKSQVLPPRSGALKHRILKLVYLSLKSLINPLGSGSVWKAACPSKKWLVHRVPIWTNSWNHRMLRKSRIIRTLGHFSVSPETSSLASSLLPRACVLSWAGALGEGGVEGVWTFRAFTSGQTRRCLSCTFRSQQQATHYHTPRVLSWMRWNLLFQVHWWGLLKQHRQD